MSKKQYVSPSVKVHIFKAGRIICSSPLDPTANTSGFDVDDNYDEME